MSLIRIIGIEDRTFSSWEDVGGYQESLHYSTATQANSHLRLCGEALREQRISAGIPGHIYAPRALGRVIDLHQQLITQPIISGPRNFGEALLQRLAEEDIIRTIDVIDDPNRVRIRRIER